MNKEQLLKLDLNKIKENFLKKTHNKGLDCYYCENMYNCSHCYYSKNCNHCNFCNHCYDLDRCEVCEWVNNCVDCYNCKHCSYCDNIVGGRYMVLNIQLTEEEYNSFMKKL